MRSRRTGGVMSIVDKAKAAAEGALSQARQGAAQGRARLMEMQARQQHAMLVRQLGEACFAEHSGEGTHQEVARAFAALDALMQANPKTLGPGRPRAVRPDPGGPNPRPPRARRRTGPGLPPRPGATSGPRPAGGLPCHDRGQGVLRPPLVGTPWYGQPVLAGAPFIGFIPVRDPSEARNFYEGTLGLRVVEDAPFPSVLDPTATILHLTPGPVLTAH